MASIGFCSENQEKNSDPVVPVESPRSNAPRKSVVQVHFPDECRSLAYYNDRYDLRVGDFVYVDGKLEGLRGRVIEVNYTFKIKLSEYKRVISLVDTDVHGQFFAAGSHFVTFERSAVPAEKVRTWYMAPAKDDDEYASGSDGISFALDDLNSSGGKSRNGMEIAPHVALRGHEYYMENNVRYICVDGTRGYAVVEGTKPYEVEFEFRDGMISDLTCSCFCSYNCKHEFAAMLQLKETLELIGRHYADKHRSANYFAAVLKSALFSMAVDGKETGSFTM